MAKIIFFELNEVPLKIIEYFTKVRPQSWLAQNIDYLKKYETYSENKGQLSPWNTWPTVHRGVANDQHYIAELNQDLSEVDKEFAPIWNILKDHGRSVGVFGSLHSYPLPDHLNNFKFYVPDVFSPTPESHPEYVEFFQEVNLRLSRKSGKNIDNSIPVKDALKGISKVGKLGFTASTISSLGKQLLGEKLAPWKSTRRRTFQSVLSFDVFYKLLDKERPDFTTYFTNHVASSLHRYWAAVFPNEYENLLYDEEWLATYSNEIIFTMTHADKMLKKLALFVDKNPEYKLIFTSSMGQEAVESEPTERQLMIRDNHKFLSMLGLENAHHYTVLPAMVPQFNYLVAPDHQSDFENKLQSLTINGESVAYKKMENGRFSIDLKFKNLKSVLIQLNGLEVPLEQSGLTNEEIEDKSSTTAYHVPEGHLFTYHPSLKNSVISEVQMPTTDILPILLNNFNVPLKSYMNKVDYSDI